MRWLRMLRRDPAFATVAVFSLAVGIGANSAIFTPRSHPVVVVGHGLWQRRFDADPNLIGQTVTINGQKLTVVGIAPPRYTGLMGGLAADVWVPMMTLPLLEPTKGNARLSRASRWLTLVGRLKPDTTIGQAKARFELLSRDMQAAHPEEWRSTNSSGAVRCCSCRCCRNVTRESIQARRWAPMPPWLWWSSS